MAKEKMFKLNGYKVKFIQQIILTNFHDTIMLKHFQPNFQI